MKREICEKTGANGTKLDMRRKIDLPSPSFLTGRGRGLQFQELTEIDEFGREIR